MTSSSSAKQTQVVFSGSFTALKTIKDQQEEIRAVLSDISGMSDAYASQKAQETIDRIENYRPKITVFGRSGVGKTSLVNALSGRRDLLPTGPENATAVPVNVCLNLRAASKECAARMKYFSRKDWSRLARSTDQVGHRSQREDQRFAVENIIKEIGEGRNLDAMPEERSEELFQSQRDQDLLNLIRLPRDEQQDKLPIEAELYLSAPWVPGHLVLLDTPGLSNDPLGERLSVMTMRSAQTSVLMLSADELLTPIEIACLKILRSPSRMVFLFVNGELSQPQQEIQETIREQLEDAGLDGAMPVLFGHVGQKANAVEADVDADVMFAVTQAMQADTDNGSDGVSELAQALSEDVATRQGEKFIANLMLDCKAILSAMEDGRDAKESVKEVDFVALDTFFENAFMRLKADFGAEIEEHRAEMSVLVSDYAERFAQSAVEHALEKGAGKDRSVMLFKPFDPFYVRLSALTGWFNAAVLKSLKHIARKLEGELSEFMEGALSANACSVGVDVPSIAPLGRSQVRGEAVMVNVPKSCSRPWLLKKQKEKRLKRFIETETLKYIREMTKGLRGEALQVAVNEAEIALDAMLEATKTDILNQVGADWSEYEDVSQVRVAG